MRTPYSNGQHSGVSNGNTTTTTKRLKNKISPLGELKVTLVNDATAAQPNLIVMPGPVINYLVAKQSASKPDQQHCTLASSVSGVATTANAYADYVNYLALVSLHITYIRITTTDVNNFMSSLWIGEVPPNGILNPEEIPLSSYRTALGGGTYDTTLLINDREFVISKNFFMYLSNMTVSSTFVFNFGIGGYADTAEITATA